MVLQMDSARQNQFKPQQKITNCNKCTSKDSTLMLSNEFGFCSISSDGVQVQALLQNEHFFMLLSFYCEDAKATVLETL